MAGGEGLFSKNTSCAGSPQINMLMEAGWGEVGACFCSRGRVRKHQLQQKKRSPIPTLTPFDLL